MVKYVEMTLEDAIKYCNGKKKVLVAVKDLENGDDLVQNFYKKTEKECKEMIMESQTIVNFYDDFMDQMRLFSVKQPDIFNIVPKGMMKTILFPPRK